MSLLSWSDQYQIGNLTIDTEHKELFRLVNTFHDHWLENRDRRGIPQILNQLVNYTETHFQHEEAIMQEAGYPKLEEHQQIHATMVETIFALQQSFEENNDHLEIDTMKFVKAWLLEHILESDYLFRDFLARKLPAEKAEAAQ